MNYHNSDGPKFKLTYDENPNNSRINLSSTTICSCALSQYLDLWKENNIPIKDYFGALKNYYEYIIEGLNGYLNENSNKDQEHSSNEFFHLNTSTDEFVLLNILSHLRIILEKVRVDEKNDNWSHKPETILKIIELLYKEYSRDNKKFKYKGDTHPYIYYAFMIVLSDWKKELLCRKDAIITPDNFNRVIDENYEIGKYEMYRQMALYKSNDRSLFDAKRLIYSLLIVTIDKRYSNDKIKKEVLEIIFKEQLETGLWPIGSVVNADFILESGKINRESFRLIAMSRILSSVECLNDMLLHDDLKEDLDIYQSNLNKTYNWIIKRLREREVDMFPLFSSKDIQNPNDIMKKIEKANSHSGGKDYENLINSIRAYGDLGSQDNKAKMNEIKGKLASGINELLLVKFSDSSKDCYKGGTFSDQIDIISRPDFAKKVYDTFINDVIVKNSIKENFIIPLGWYPEYEASRESKSWVAGHTLLFLIKYCELISRLIEKESIEYLQAWDSKHLMGTWGDLRSSYKIKEILNNMVQEPGKSNQEYRSAFIYGPPGTGKSSIARALARELGWNYVEITPGQFLEEGEPNIIKKATSLFKRLIQMGNTVIFFDEVDQLVELRSETSGSSSKWILTSLLPKFQELYNQKDIKFILATNKIDRVDSAMRRRGRIDFVLPMGALCWKDRIKMLKEMVQELEDSGRSNAYTMFPELFLQKKERIRDEKAVDRLKKRNIVSENMKTFLIKTDFKLFQDTNDLISVIKKVLMNEPETSGLFKSFFSNSSEYFRYMNRDLAYFDIIQLPRNKEDNFRLTPALQTRIEKQFGFEAIINDNSFSSLLLSEGDIRDIDKLLDRIYKDYEHADEDSLSHHILLVSKSHNLLRKDISELKNKPNLFFELNEELKKLAQNYLQIDTADEELSIEDLDSLKKINDSSKAMIIDEKVQEYLAILGVKNKIITGLNKIIMEDDLYKYTGILDEDTRKHLDCIKANKKPNKKPNGLEGIRANIDKPTGDEVFQIKRMIANRLIFEKTYFEEISSILTYEIKISGFEDTVRKYTFEF